MEPHFAPGAFPPKQWRGPWRRRREWDRRGVVTWERTYVGHGGVYVNFVVQPERSRVKA